jgi:hypothetical protein
MAAWSILDCVRRTSTLHPKIPPSSLVTSLGMGAD